MAINKALRKVASRKLVGKKKLCPVQKHIYMLKKKLFLILNIIRVLIINQTVHNVKHRNNKINNQVRTSNWRMIL